MDTRMASMREEWPPRKAACFLWDKIVAFARNIVIEKITVYIFMYLAVSILLAAIYGYDELIECNAEASWTGYDRYDIFGAISHEVIEDTVVSVVSVAKYDNGIIWAIFGSG